MLFRSAKRILGDPLYVYLSVSEEAVSSVLVRIKGSEHLPVYYLSKVQLPSEINYQEIEKYALSLVNTARKLKPYFQAHLIIVVRVCVGTWNVAGKVPPQDLDIQEWLDMKEPADIYVLG